MTIAELYDKIERLLVNGPRCTRDLATELQGQQTGPGGPSLYDTIAAVNALYRASRIKPTAATEDQAPTLIQWELDARGNSKRGGTNASA